MSRYSKIEPLFYWLILAIHLIPVWESQYFLTGDGPSHVYNAKVILDYTFNQNWDFYDEYYSFNTYPEPNWTSHFLLAGLLTIFPDFWAEKLLITFYIITFGLSWRFLIRQINPENTLILLAGLPFIFHRTFQMGFYNYSFGIAVMLLLVAYWLKFRKELDANRICVMGLLFLLLYFCHPVGLTFACAILGLVWFCDLWGAYRTAPKSINQLLKENLKQTFFAFIASLPALILLFIYLLRRGIETTPNPYSKGHMFRKLVELTSLVNMSNKEVNWAIAWAVLCGILLVAGLIYKIQRPRFNQYDGFLLAFFLTLFMYFIQPGSIGGAGVLYIRLQFIPFLMLLIWVASLPLDKRLYYFLMIPVIVIPLVLISLRTPHHKKASEAVQEYLSVRPLIKDRSTVLPLSFAHQGLSADGLWVSDRIWLFMHAADYLGSDKSLVMLGNYEAGLGYFPIVWHQNKQPFFHIATNEGIEGRPPSVDLLSYQEKTGGTIDYVLTWCIEGEFSNHPYTIDLKKQLNVAYELIFTSQNGLARLYKFRDAENL